jgi:hypothetical protein
MAFEHYKAMQILYNADLKKCNREKSIYQIS